MSEQSQNFHKSFNATTPPHLKMTFNLATPRNSFAFVETCSHAEQTDNHPIGHSSYDVLDQIVKRDFSKLSENVMRKAWDNKYDDVWNSV